MGLLLLAKGGKMGVCEKNEAFFLFFVILVVGTSVVWTFSSISCCSSLFQLFCPSSAIFVLTKEKRAKNAREVYYSA